MRGCGDVRGERQAWGRKMASLGRRMRGLGE